MDVHLLKFVSSTENLQAVLDAAQNGIQRGHTPELCPEGVGGVYFLKNEKGKNIGVFKPQDEEPFNLNNPKGYRPRRNSWNGFKEGILTGEASLRECAAFMLDYGHFAGVPATGLVQAEHNVFYLSQEATEGLVDVNLHALNQGKKKMGSFQKFIKHEGDTEDAAPRLIAKFPIDEVHKIAVLDLRIFNTDRHGGNILYREKRAPDGVSRQYSLIPIDHGYCLPATIENNEAWFAWQQWPQVKEKMSPKTLEYIRQLDIEKDIRTLAIHFPGQFRYEHFRVLRMSTMTLKRGAEFGLTLYEISNIFSRLNIKKPSVLERIFSEAEFASQGEEDTFWTTFSDLLDVEIQKIVRK